MPSQQVFRNEPAGLAEDGSQRACVQLAMSWHDQNLYCARCCDPPQFHVTALLGVYVETMVCQNSNDLFS